MSSKDSEKAGAVSKGGTTDSDTVSSLVAAAIEALKAAAAKDPSAASAAIAALEDIAKTAPIEQVKSIPKRAICLGGGGPAVGLHIGALEGLKKRNIDFGNRSSVWALSCIGAWAGVIYNQAKRGQETETTYNFFHDIFRDAKPFESFP